MPLNILAKLTLLVLQAAGVTKEMEQCASRPPARKDVYAIHEYIHLGPYAKKRWVRTVMNREQIRVEPHAVARAGV